MLRIPDKFIAPVLFIVALNLGMTLGGLVAFVIAGGRDPGQLPIFTSIPGIALTLYLSQLPILTPRKRMHIMFAIIVVLTVIAYFFIPQPSRDPHANSYVPSDKDVLEMPEFTQQLKRD